MKSTVVSLLFVAFTSALLAADTPRVKRIDVEEFDKLRRNTNNIVLDVRTEREFKAGHLPGAVNIDVNSPGFARKISELDRNKTYLVHCQSGRRSANACEKLSKAGFATLYDLAPGFKGWTNAAKPFEK